MWGCGCVFGELLQRVAWIGKATTPQLQVCQWWCQTCSQSLLLGSMLKLYAWLCLAVVHRRTCLRTECSTQR